MTDLFVLIIYLSFFVFGLTRPYIAFAGYIWVDIIGPQFITYGFMSGRPLSMVMAMLCIVSIVLNFNKLSKPKGAAVPILIVLFALWVTLTTYYAYFPTPAWYKWDVSIKTLIMSFLLLFVVNSKKQLEFIIITFSLSIGYFVMIAGMKSAAGGGGYGARLISSSGNSGLSESSTLAMVAVLLIPFVLFLKNHTLLFSHLKRYWYMWNLSVLVVVASVIGTTARTGLIALSAYVAIYIMRTKNKLRNITIVALTVYLSFSFFVTDEWTQRMDTLQEVQTEGSAMGRIMVWRWTIDFVKENPMGGGFGSFRANGGEWQLYNDPPYSGTNFKAYHSVYFEVLGEHGYAGLCLFLMLIAVTFLNNNKIYKDKTTSVEDPWFHTLALTLNHCLIIFCVAGAFIGVAFQPVIYSLIAFSALLRKIWYKQYYA